MEQSDARVLARRLGELTRAFVHAEEVLTVAALAEESVAAARAQLADLAAQREAAAEALAALQATHREARDAHDAATAEGAQRLGALRREIADAEALSHARRLEAVALLEEIGATHEALAAAEAELGGLRAVWAEEAGAHGARVAGLAEEESRLRATVEELRADLRALQAKIPAQL